MSGKIGLEAVMKMGTFKSATSEYNRLVGEMNDKTARGAGGITATFQNMSGAALRVASALGTALVAGATAAAAALTGIIVSGTKAAVSMEQQVANIAAIFGVAKDKMEPLAELIIDLGMDPRLKVTAEEAAEAIQLLARNGLNMTQIMDGAAFSTVLLANSTGTTFGNAANIATDAMAMFSIEAADMGDAVDGITSVTTNSKFTIDDFALALANGGAVASASGISFDDFNTTIAALAPNFASGATAGTAVKNLLLRLAPVAQRAKDTMAELGFVTEDGTNLFFDEHGAMKGMADISQILQDKLGGLSTQQRNLALKTIFGNDAMGAAIGLMNMGAESGEGAAAAFAALQEQMGKTDAAESAATKMDTVSGALEILQGVIDTIKLRIGQGFLPILREMIGRLQTFVDSVGPPVLAFFEKVSDFVSVFARAVADGVNPLDAMAQGLDGLVPEAMLSKIIEITQGVQNFIQGVVTYVTEHSGAFIGAIKALGVAFAALVIAGVVVSLLSLINPVTLIIAAIGLLGAAWSENWGGIQDRVAEAWAVVQPILENIRDTAVTVFNAFAGGAPGDFPWEDIFPGWLADAMYVISDLFENKLPVAIETFQSVLSTVGSTAVDLWQNILPEKISQAIDKIVETIDTFKTSLNQTGNPLTAFVNTLISLVGPASNAATIIRNVRNVLVTVFGTLKALVMSVFEPLKIAFVDMFGGLGESFAAFAPLGEQFAAFWEALKPALIIVAEIIGGIIVVAIGLVVGLINGLLNAINPLLVTIANVLGNLVGMATGFLQIFTGLWDLIIGVFTGNSEKIQAGAVSMWEGLKAIWTNLRDGIINLVIGLGLSLAALLQGIYDGAYGFFKSLYDALVGESIIPDMVNGIIEWIRNLALWFLEAIATMVVDVLSKAIELYTIFVSTIALLVADIVELATKLRDMFLKAMATLVIKVLAKALELKDGFVAKVAELKTAVVAKFVEIKDMVIGKMGEMLAGIVEFAQQFKDAGYNLLQSLGAGILSAVSGTIDAAKQAVSQIIDGVKAAAGMHSPSKIFVGFGSSWLRDIGSGFADMVVRTKRSMEQTLGQLPGMNIDVNQTLRSAVAGSNGIFSQPSPSTVSLDSDSLSALRSAGPVDNSRNFNLNNSSAETTMQVREAFTIMELLGG